MRILIFDTETSGLNPQWNVILQLSYQIVDSDSWTVQKTVNHYFSWPENKARVSSDAIKVNGLTEEVLKDKQLSERRAAFEEFVADKDSCDLLVAHNLEFDKKFIIASCREEGVKYASSGWMQSYDTMKRMTNYCHIPKSYGSGYKWPKLTELADCLSIDYSHMVLHDSSADVELTKLCFKQIVSLGLYSFPKETDMTVSLHVESPDELHFEVRKNGELVSQSVIDLLIPKKTWKSACQELIKLWSEENEEERNSLIHIYRKSPKLVTEENLRAEIEATKPNLYKRKVFEEETPSKIHIQEELEQEAEREVSSWMFWTLKKKRQEYVEARLESYYQKQFDAYNQRLAQHEESENKAERDYNMKSLKRCEERKQRLAALIEGSNVELIREEMLRVPDVMSLPFPYHVESHLDNKAISIILSLPQPQHLPHMEGVRLASGNYKIKEIPDKKKRSDYSEWVFGLAFYVAAYYFNVSPKVDAVRIEGHVDTEETNNILLYTISFDRTTFGSLDYENIELETALSSFSFANNLTKEVLVQLFPTKEGAKQNDKDKSNSMCDPRFSKDAVDLWGLTPPLTDFADEYEIWETVFYTIYGSLGRDFKGSFFGFVEPKVNEDYSVEYASGRYKLASYSPQGELLQELDAMADKYVQWVGLHKCPFVGYAYKKTESSLPEGIVWIIAPKSRDQVLSSASAFYKRRRKKNEIPNIIDLPLYLEKNNSIGKITDSSSFVPLRKRKLEGRVRPSATKKRIEEYRTTAPELTDSLLVQAIKDKYGNFFTDNEEVAMEAIKETYRNELPLTLENVMEQLGYLVEDRRLLQYYTELQHIYSPEAQEIREKADKVVEEIYVEACKRTCRLSEFADKIVLDFFSNESYKHRENMTLADKLNNLCCNYHCRINGLVSCSPGNYPPFIAQQDGDDVIFVNKSN